MAVGTIDNNAFVQQIIDKGLAEANKRNTGEMGKQEFLNLLVLQLRYQDPLNPVEDKEFIAQMAQFSALEQMQAMNASNTAMKGFSMIGKYVSALVADGAMGRQQVVEGHVESVIIKGSNTFLMVAGREVPIDNVYNVADGYNPLNSTLSAYTGLIGYHVKGAVFDITTGDIVGVNGEVVSLLKGAYEDYAILNGVEAVVAGINNNGAINEDRNKLREYLDGVLAKDDPADRRVEVFITDENGKRVPVSATLVSYELDPYFGTVKAVFNDVAVPVASVASIQKTAQPADKTNNKQDGDSGDTGEVPPVDGDMDEPPVDGGTGTPADGAGGEETTDGGADGSQETP